MTRPCTVDDCTRPVVGRGLCGAHWNRWKLYGDPRATKPRPTLEDRFWAKVQPTGFCWEWTARRDSNGYGMFYVGGDRLMDRAHRVAYELLVGPIPAGLSIDHLCRNRSCCNPDHLEPVTPAENTLRNASIGSLTARTDVCKRGHSMANAYIRPDTGRRQCAECIRLRTAGVAA